MQKEEWRAVVGYVGWYEVSNLGRVRNARTRYTKPPYRHVCSRKGHVLATILSTQGYPQAHLYKNGVAKTKEVHRLVMTAFLGERPKTHHGHHIDGNPLNNALGNLTYMPVAAHLATRAFRRGTQQPGAKLTEDTVRAIRRFHAEGARGADLARWFGVSASLVYKVCRRRLWAHVA